ncbi:hypothetical protein [Pseudalkalibacillus caeni]|uniref:Uncharacterized protein n=1 Tax=Exobacillus caeni TaxID=2574798 RepID=A0A5R9F5Z3_9BACL|nr:hypothetical protein [Pseudalkalibacillus caeni]TLS37756.1 hypothetical protein FCL54_08010 [Pseudalkalibacillus caeni]
MNNTNARLKLIEGAIADSVEEYGDYETVKLDSADAHWLVDMVREFQKENSKDKALLKWHSENLHAYMCSVCDNRFHIEEILYPTHVTCPYCGENDVCINSKDYAKLGE